MVHAPTDLGTLRPDGGAIRVFPEAYGRHAEQLRDPLLPTVGRWRLVSWTLSLLLVLASILAWRLAIEESLDSVERILAIEHPIVDQPLDG